MVFWPSGRRYVHVASGVMHTVSLQCVNQMPIPCFKNIFTKLPSRKIWLVEGVGVEIS